jgi:hypothetical protein
MIKKIYFYIFILLVIPANIALCDSNAFQNGIEDIELPVPTKVEVYFDSVEVDEDDFLPSTRLVTSVELQPLASQAGFIFFARRKTEGAIFKPICIVDPEEFDYVMNQSAECITTELTPGNFEVFARMLSPDGQVSKPSVVSEINIPEPQTNAKGATKFRCIGKPYVIGNTQPKVSISREMFFNNEDGLFSDDFELITVQWERLCVGFLPNKDITIPGFVHFTDNVNTRQIRNSVGYGSPRTYHVFFGNPFLTKLNELDPGLDVLNGERPSRRIDIGEQYVRNFRTNQSHLIYKRIATVDGDTNRIDIKRPLKEGDAVCKIDDLTGFGRFMLQDPPIEEWSVVAELRPLENLKNQTKIDIDKGNGSILFDSRIIK